MSGQIEEVADVRITRVLVATDLKKKSEAAIRYAQYLAGQLDAAIVVSHVVQSRDLQVEEGEHRPARVGDEAVDRARRDMAGQLEKLGVGEVISDVRFGDPGLDVIAAAHEHRCDLIVLTVQSRSKLGKLLMGSHAQQVLLDSPIPVVAVKPDWVAPG